ncbi:hypothetical protein [Adhaeribacter aquaticus]|uniref:hypothetical protein n=1 Tax=Adhaeribacter aquaticus TaxID=299567 RepID=UPI00047DC0F6|nr:hypothetical protein [Adhaeribacter aquaticus]
MLLFQNSLIVLDYEPSTDILSVKWPNVERYLLPEVKMALKTVVEYITSYDVKKLLIDASTTQSSPGLIDSPEYKEIITNFVISLPKTRLQKSARIIALDAEREIKTQKLTSEIKSETKYQIESRDFRNKEDAITWLKSSPYSQ